MPTIDNKAQMYAAMKAGKFGNTNTHWYALEDYLRSGYPGLVGLRGGTKGWPTRYNLTREEVIALWPDAPPGSNISPMLPDQKILLQGEVKDTEMGLALHCSTVKAPMKTALSTEFLNLYGFNAHMALKRHLWPSDLADLYILLNQYPGHVVEFSSYSVPVGCIPHRNTVIWEVRNY